MYESIFTGLFDGSGEELIAMSDFLLCVAVSLLIGLFLAWVYCFRSRHTRSFTVTLALLPAIVCVVIMMVNGNIGAGVAVAGAFSLVRFRSLPGTAKDIGMIFLAMAAGLITGMGYLGYAVLFSLIIGLAMLLFTSWNLGGRQDPAEKSLRIMIPEDLDYTTVFNDAFAEYTTHHELTTVKTTNLGSMFRLDYDVTLKDPANEKNFIDALRVKNGNLEVQLSKVSTQSTEL